MLSKAGQWRDGQATHHSAETIRFRELLPRSPVLPDTLRRHESSGRKIKKISCVMWVTSSHAQKDKANQFRLAFII